MCKQLLRFVVIFAIYGSGKVWLTDGFEPDWLPDGCHIIYHKRGDDVHGKPYDDDDPKVHGSVWMMNVDTKEQWQFLPKDEDFGGYHGFF